MLGSYRTRKNAPSFIYEILHGRPMFIRGRTVEHQTKNWKGISVDVHIPNAALDELNDIREIELRSSCEGSGIDRPTFLIFRFYEPKDEGEIRAFVKGMNAIDGIWCGADIGAMGRFRIGVTAPLWYEKDPEKFTSWWLELPKMIRIVLITLQVLNLMSR